MSAIQSRLSIISSIRKSLIALISLIAALSASAANLATSADSAYDAESYPQAAALYEETMASEGESSDLYYNLGNTYYRMGQNAKAILAYERALRIDPANDDARTNLAFVNDRIIDKKGETGSFLSNSFDSITCKTSSNGWAIWALCFFVLTIGAVVLYYFAPIVIAKKIGFFGGLATLVLCVVFIIFSFHAETMSTRTDFAIITSPTTVLSTVPRSPANRNEEAMLLHEGTKVKILNSVTFSADTTAQTWHDVEVDNNHRAWINDADIEKIIQ